MEAQAPKGFSGAARALAGLIAVTAGVGLAAQFWASTVLVGTAGGALWSMLRYFTVTTNLVLAGVFAAIAFGGLDRRGASLIGGVTLAILLVGVIYGLLLRDLVELSGGARFADLLLHHATPILAPLFWLAYGPRGQLSRRDPLLWALYPLAYFAYALARGMTEGIYPYPFMDVWTLGWSRTLSNAAIIALGFVGAGYVALWLDARVTRRAAAP